METNQTSGASLLVLASLCPLLTLPLGGGVTFQCGAARVGLSVFQVSARLERACVLICCLGHE